MRLAQLRHGGAGGRQLVERRGVIGLGALQREGQGGGLGGQARALLTQLFLAQQRGGPLAAYLLVRVRLHGPQAPPQALHLRQRRLLRPHVLLVLARHPRQHGPVAAAATARQEHRERLAVHLQARQRRRVAVAEVLNAHLVRDVHLQLRQKLGATAAPSAAGDPSCASRQRRVELAQHAHWHRRGSERIVARFLDSHTNDGRQGQKGTEHIVIGERKCNASMAVRVSPATAPPRRRTLSCEAETEAHLSAAGPPP